MNQAVFLDKDGTLIRDVPYNIDPSLIDLEEGVAAGLRHLKRMGFLLVIVSNQPGIAHGYFEEEALQDVFREIRFQARTAINGFYYCPHHPAGKITSYRKTCECRKPGPGLLLQAARELDIDLSRSWMIGDILNDIEAGNRAGCRSILIDNGNETEWELHKERVPDHIVNNFTEAVIHIKRHTGRTIKEYDEQLAGM